MGEFNLASLLQLTLNGIVSGTAYALLAVGVASIVGVTGRFHVAITVSYTLAAFVAAWLGGLAGVPFWPALLVGALCAALAGILMEAFVYLPLSLTAMRLGANVFLMTFVASLGLSIVGRNVLALTSLMNPSLLISGFNNVGLNVGPATITTLDLTMVVTSWALIGAFSLVLSLTSLGRMIRAVRANWQMSLCVGIDPRLIYRVVFGAGSFLAGAGGIFAAAKTSATPGMGVVPLFYALVVAFLAGLATPPWLVGLAGLTLGLVQSYSSLFLPTQWTPLLVFAILFVFVALRPLDVRALQRRFIRTQRQAG